MNKYKFILALLIVLSFNHFAIATPQQYNAFINAASVSMQSGRYQIAIDNYQKALKLYPNNANIYNNLGVAYSRKNDLNNAEINYKKAITLDPSNAFAYSNLSNLYEREHKYSLALKYLEAYAKLSPSDKNIYDNLSTLYAKTGNKELCIKYGEKNIQISNDKYNAYFAMGENCKRFKDFDNASYYYRKALDYSNNTTDRNDVAYIMQELRNCQFKKNINTIKPVVKAPQALYNLIKTEPTLKNDDSFYKLQEILDLMWADENGNILLNDVIRYKIPIIITPGGTEQTNAKTETSYKKTPLYYMGMVPMPVIVAVPMSLAFATFHPDVKKETKITINLGEDVIDMYKSKDSNFETNMYSLMSVMHESGHAVASAVDNNHKNSIEEELTVSMIGYNFASNVLIGRFISPEESREYALDTFNSLMNDSHKNLPLYGNFKNIAYKLGLNLYNYETYSDLYSLKQQAANRGK